MTGGFSHAGLVRVFCPRGPADLQQRPGRIECQGNLNDEAEVYRYVTEGIFDAYLFQLVKSKQRFIGQAMTSKSPVRAASDVDETARLAELDAELDLDRADNVVPPDSGREEPAERKRGLTARAR